MMNVLIVDDEPLARIHQRRLLEAQGVVTVDEAESVAEGLQKAEDLYPDVLFLDIQMPGLSGLQMAAALQSLDNPPLIIFVTGYSEYALAAFEHSAFDYLVKPLTPERLARTLLRARARLAERLPTNQSANDARSIRQVDREPAPTASVSPPLTRLPIREDGSVRLLRLHEILSVSAREDRTYVRTSEEEYRTYYTLKQLELLLPVQRFVRVHESYLVNTEEVAELHFLGNHAYVVRLSNGMQIPVSRSRYPHLKHLLGIDRMPD